MDVLIADFDFFSTAGGGQTYYRKLVEQNPDIRFHFFTKNPYLVKSWAKQRLMLPANAFPILYRRDRRLPALLNVMANQFPSISSEIIYWLVDEAANMSYSVAGQTFDVVDVPSFRPFILFLAAMFKYNGVQCDSYVLSIHGWAHKAVGFAWESSESLVHSLLAIENECLEGADIRYEISRFSLQHTQSRTSFPLEYYDIHNILDSISITKKIDSLDNMRPDIWFPARLDRQKGVDIFLEIAARLPKHLYGSIQLCGPDGKEAGRTWSNRVHALAQQLKVKISYHGSLNRTQIIEQVFSKPNYCIFPSRYDSFGLAITEALFSGCPVAASDQCGASHFLVDEYPDIPFTMFDVNNLDTTVQRVSEDLERYAELRKNLNQKLLKCSVKSWPQNSVIPIYSSQRDCNLEQRVAMEKVVFPAIMLAKSMKKPFLIAVILRVWYLFKSNCPEPLRRILRQIFTK